MSSGVAPNDAAAPVEADDNVGKEGSGMLPNAVSATAWRSIVGFEKCRVADRKRESDRAAVTEPWSAKPMPGEVGESTLDHAGRPSLPAELWKGICWNAPPASAPRLSI